MTKVRPIKTILNFSFLCHYQRRIHKTTLKLTLVHVLFLVLAGGWLKDSDLKKKPMNFVMNVFIFLFCFSHFMTSV